MTDSPSPIDSSFDASDVATPCTVIAAKISLRNRNGLEEDQENLDSFDAFTETHETQESKNIAHGEHEEDVSNIYVDDFSKEFGDTVSSVMEPLPKPLTFARTITKVYCHLDDQEHPYMVEVHVPPDCITLRDVKRKLMRTNFKYYCIALDPDTGLEVKAEVRDDSRRLYPLKNGRFELYLLTVEGSVHSDTSSGRHRRKQDGSSKGSSGSREYLRAAHHYDNPTPFSDDESQASSLPTYVKKAHAYNRKHAPQAYERHLPHMKHNNRHNHHRQNHYEESTFDVTTESDDHYRDGVTYYDEDEDDSRSINTDLTSVSQVHLKQKWRQQQKEMRNKWKRMPSISTASSSFSSITESSMGLEVITVRLNLETIPLGMTPSGHTNARGDAGLYVGDIQDRGAVALDGRIDIGDMIVGINEISLGNYSNKEAVQLLREAVQRQYLTLTIAKTGDPKQNAFPRNPRAEPIRPIDPNEWVKHATNAMKAMPSISEESSSTPIPDDWPTNSSASGTPFGGPPPANCLNVMTDKKYVVEVMAAPGSGLDIKDRYWFKIPIPMSFLGTDLVEWLVKHVQGLETKKKAREFAEEMLKLGYIRPGVGKQSFTKECYYVMGDECADYTQLRGPDGGYKYPQSHASSASGHSSNNLIFPPSMYPPQPPTAGAVHHRNSVILPSSMTGGYASLPASPFPHGKASVNDCRRTRDDQRSQASGSSRGSSRRYVELPRKPASLSSGSGLAVDLDRVASRSSFRAAMNGSHPQFNIDN
ncbi:LOW QUALITY PROTEIN: DiSHevelled related [Caenorhabditis elegans]|uniref:DiSHevelled related n=1 Tax=Caenorhabditis elegans TaxID=6239 RepID=Q18239_CAEEL|nr:LOW QUALITY PROTEIN: DiSHevelled related [Caenorhabditis elegans]CCD63074.2 LOW QUALITY PROTEIN: DiSHevelled related [Caenorhabditis elegans]|eukprot:NP_494937.4 LOW QUALITY PROTEIN: DiSHevelled related [Caenorhabditis elegans]